MSNQTATELADALEGSAAFLKSSNLIDCAVLTQAAAKLREMETAAVECVRLTQEGAEHVVQINQYIEELKVVIERWNKYAVAACRDVVSVDDIDRPGSVRPTHLGKLRDCFDRHAVTIAAQAARIAELEAALGGLLAVLPDEDYGELCDSLRHIKPKTAHNMAKNCPIEEAFITAKDATQ